jgi:hypothetical protein
MSALQRALEAAQERKTACVDGEPGIVFADSEFQDRAIFSGFDIEYGELVATSTAIAELYAHTAHNIGLRSLFISSWCDGLLTGLMLAHSLPPTSDPRGTDDTGLGGVG